MAQDRSPRCKRCRQEGEKLFLKGERCFSEHCPLTHRGAAEKGRGKRISAYSIQFRAKQRLKFVYGMLESQFRRAFEMAERKGVPTQTLLVNLERRLDNVVYRLGFAGSRRQARQLVAHGHIRVDGRRVDIPSYLVRQGSVVELSPKARGFRSVQLALDAKESGSVMGWLSLDRDQARGEVLRFPTPEELSDVPADPRLVVELYSK